MGRHLAIQRPRKQWHRATVAGIERESRARRIAFGACLPRLVAVVIITTAPAARPGMVRRPDRHDRP
jgi:hypothetical protein